MNKEQIAYEKGYRVTKDGQLLNPKGKKISGCVNNRGYKHLSFKINKKHNNLLIHRLQAYQKYVNELFGDGIVVRHLNGNRLDNSWNNIAIGTQKDNAMDIPKQIRIKRGISAGKAAIKYPKEFVLKLKEEYKLIKNYSELGRKYNISTSVIWELINKRKVFKDA